MARTYDQVVKFTTDAVGIERSFRFCQAIIQILLAYPSLLLPFLTFISLLASTLSLTPPKSPSVPDLVSAVPILSALKNKINLARRNFRIFRSLESFGGAHKAYSSLSSPSPPPQNGKPSPLALKRAKYAKGVAYLDILSKSFNGMYLLLETSIFLDVQQIPGLTLFEKETSAMIAVEAQRFWLFALACGAGAGLVRIAGVVFTTALPGTAERVGDGVGGEAEGQTRDEGLVEDDEKEKKGGEWDVRQEQARLKGIGTNRRLAREAWRKQVIAETYKLGRGVLANCLDITLPGTVVGWIPAGPGVVGWAMLGSTILTGRECWDRCGREVGGSQDLDDGGSGSEVKLGRVCNKE
ncbi:hypothetical protein F5Y18DRAFT_280604 [Xylariaceae sp. FL1019]|nr:hypothetical protein F5Y18DRAFT_280604 [Xylariaceae sp. FL1019]